MTTSTFAQPFAAPLPLDRPGSGNPTQHFRFLDGLRGAVSCYVAAYHFIAWVPSILPVWITRLQKPLSFGHVSVSVFIVLSGFSLMLPVARSPNQQMRGGTRAYFKRRAWRILPAYYASFLLALAVTTLRANAGDPMAGQELTPASIATHFLLIHNLFHAHIAQLNVAHWTVAAEWQIYFLMPFFFLPIRRRAGTAVMLLAAFSLSALPLIVLPQRHNLAWTCPWYIGLFAFGMSVATIDISSLGQRVRPWLLPAFAGLIAIYLTVYKFNNATGFERPGINFIKDVIAGTAVGALILYCLDLSMNSGPRPILLRALESAPLVALGACSYSLYLTHISVLDVMLLIGRRCHWSDSSAFFARTLIGLPLAVALAFIFARLFQRPFMVRRR